MNNFMKLSGPVTEPDAVCDEILMSAFASDYSQSNAFLGHISSFQYLVQNSDGNFRTLATSLERMFNQLFKRYFPVADMTVTTKVMEDKPSHVAVTLSGSLTTGAGQRYDLAAQLIAADGLVIKMLVGERVLWSK